MNKENKDQNEHKKPILNNTLEEIKTKVTKENLYQPYESSEEVFSYVVHKCPDNLECYKYLVSLGFDLEYLKKNIFVMLLDGFERNYINQERMKKVFRYFSEIGVDLLRDNSKDTIRLIQSLFYDHLDVFRDLLLNYFYHRTKKEKMNNYVYFKKQKKLNITPLYIFNLLINQDYDKFFKILSYSSVSGDSLSEEEEKGEKQIEIKIKEEKTKEKVKEKENNKTIPCTFINSQDDATKATILHIICMFENYEQEKSIVGVDQQKQQKTIIDEDTLDALEHKGIGFNQKMLFGLTALHLLCICNKINLKSLQLLIDYGCDLNESNEREQTAFDFICSRNDLTVDTLKFFLRNGYDLFAQNSRGKNILHKLCRLDNVSLESYEYLKTLKVNFNLVDRSLGLAPINILAEHGKASPDILKFFIQNTSDQIINSKRNTLLFAAIFKPRSNLKLFIEYLKIIIVKTTLINQLMNGEGYLHYLVKKPLTADYIEIFDLFLKKGADINLLNKYQETPCHIICRLDNIPIAILEWFILNGADLNLKDQYGRIPLHLVCENQRNPPKEIYQLLIKYKSDLNSLTKTYMEKPLDLYLGKTDLSIDIIKIFLQHGSKLRSKTQNSYKNFFKIFNQTNISVDVVELFLKNKFKINYQNSTGDTVLHILCDYFIAPPIEIFHLFEKYKVKINTTNNNQVTPFHILCNNNNITLPIVKFFIKQNAKINAKNEKKYTPFTILCLQDQITDEKISIIKFLIKKGANFKMLIGPLKRNLIHLLLLKKDTSFDLIKLLIESGLDYQLKDKLKFTPIHFLFKKNTIIPIEHFEYLINLKKIDLNQITNDGENPLHVLSNKKYFDKNANMHNMDEYTVKTSIAVRKFEHIEKLFKRNLIRQIALTLKCNIDINKLNNEKKSALYYLFKNGYINFKLLKLFLKYNANLNFKNTPDKNTLLHIYCREKNPSIKIIELLINNGVDINKKNQSQNTALHILFLNHSIKLKIIKYLIQNQANPNLLNNQNQNPLFNYLSKNNSSINLKIVKFMLKSGLDIHASDAQGSTLLSEACNLSHLNFKLIKLLIKNGSQTKTEESTLKMTPLHIICSRRGDKHQYFQRISLFLSFLKSITIGSQKKRCNTREFKRFFIQIFPKRAGYQTQDPILSYSTIKDYFFSNSFSFNDQYSNERFKIAKYLIKCGAPINALDANGQSPLDYTFEMGVMDHNIYQLLIQKGSHVHKKTKKKKFDYNYFHILCNQPNPNIRVLKILLKNKINITMKCACNNLNPLHFICLHQNPNIDAIEFLLKNGIDVNALTSSNLSPLHLICSKPKPSLQIIKLLVRHGCNIDHTIVEDSFNPIHFLFFNQNPPLDAINYLITKNNNSLSTKTTKKFFFSPLHSLANKLPPFLDGIKLFINFCTDINQQDQSKKTALYYITNNFIKLNYNQITILYEFNL
ncbi:transient receptor potential cation channel subfamily a member [Anaeramoeba flamelloides]|uniref:Transient receptor potential cation channel subfamily a member n=1 Tax=Anaeramoeba flamelloides TaxID=1746091 RepID=A0AAV7Z8Q9_9EUKA|nr:transient receptor potential cation channel subfamily a member [Anaeramoeba flamelloides]